MPSESSEAVADVPTSAVAATGSPISLFGEFPDVASVPYEPKPAHPLLQHTDCPEGADFDPAVDPSGRRLAFASTRHAPNPDIYIKTVDGAAVTQVTSDPAADIQPEFSPDGRRIVFSSNRGGNFDIWVAGVDGTDPTQLTHETSHEVHPSWSPDGRRIVYCSLSPRSGQWELCVLDLHQPGLRKFIGYGLYPRWSPTEDLIVYQRARQRGQRWFSVWTLQLVNGEPRYPTEISASPDEAHILPCFSPDGERVAFCAVEDGGGHPLGKVTTSQIRIIRRDGADPIRLTEGQDRAYSPFWARDGRVYFASSRGGKETIWSLHPITSVSATRPSASGAELPDAARPAVALPEAPGKGP